MTISSHTFLENKMKWIREQRKTETQKKYHFGKIRVRERRQMKSQEKLIFFLENKVVSLWKTLTNVNCNKRLLCFQCEKSGQYRGP